MADVEFTIAVDHTEEVLAKIDQKIAAALEGCKNTAIGHATNNIAKGIPRNGGSWYHSNGDLKKSLSGEIHTDGDLKYVEVGSNSDHAAYNEYGTGKFATGGGRQGWWVYVPGSTKKSTNSHKIYTKGQALYILRYLKEQGLDAHMTEGMKPLHFLKKAIEDHKQQYVNIIKSQLNK